LFFFHCKVTYIGQILLHTECGVPPSVLNGVISYNGREVNDTATYTCEPGYDVTVSTITCLVNGFWSHIPACNPTRNLIE